jgi:hypothetical protein
MGTDGKENKGLVYEARIKSILTTHQLFTPSLAAECKHSGNDAGFIHNGKNYFLELKNIIAPDYGAKKIIYSPIANRWKWNETDEMSDLFDKLGILSKAKVFIPRKYTKPDQSLTEEDKDFDRKSFAHKVTEKELDITNLGLSGASILHQYYAKKNCFYIQIEGKGFYHLLEDPAKLGVPQFIPAVVFRLRAKTHSSANFANYSFRVVLTASRRSFLDSGFDLENPTRFPPL